MFSVFRRGTARLAAVSLATGLVATGAMALAGPAAADQGDRGAGGATAKLGGLTDSGPVDIKEANGSRWSVGRAGLFEMRTEQGGTLSTYCIDLRTGARQDFRYKEVGWDQSSLHDNGDAGKILWVLKNSYPEVAVKDLAEKVGAKDLDRNDAAAATQAAIWHFSDKVTATPADADAKLLTDYLLDKAQSLQEPKESLALSPSSVAGKSGDRVGPVTVATSASTVTLALAPGAPAGIRIVDTNGTPVKAAKNGDRVFLDVPAGTPDGSAELTARATTGVPLGRAFVSTDGPSQTLILAGSSDAAVTAGASASWAKKGAVPAVTAAGNCVKGGVDVTATNEGDEAWTFDLKGAQHTVAPGGTMTVTVPVAEDAAYDFTVTGPNGFEKSFRGVLDCKTAAPGTKPSQAPSAMPTHAVPDDEDTDVSAASPTDEGDLAETGGSSATPVIAGIAAVLVVLGGGAVFFLRRKKATGR
ncbi:LAETG motif-containing sortase-dependent surface protein [Streptomyces sp. NPDC059605]|uniref:LAETG motif-containing sortase-dependent surface protein n=1 Tax=unclassified Streptomyces TaxID=2593676 RepID=UPI003680E25F